MSAYSSTHRSTGGLCLSTWICGVNADRWSDGANNPTYCERLKNGKFKMKTR